MEDKVQEKINYIVGDSVVRAFAYSSEFFPIMISAGAFNSHLTIESSESVVERYMAFFEEYDFESETVYFFANADTMHHVRDTFNTQSHGSEALYQAASRYVDMILFLERSFKIKPILLSTVPFAGEEGKEAASDYNQFLSSLSKVKSLRYIDICRYITKETENGLEIRSEFISDDVGHLNHRFVFDFLENEGLIKGKSYWDVLYERFYNYELSIPRLKGQVARVWGDCHRDSLILSKGMGYQFDLFHKTTLEHRKALEAVSDIFKKVLPYNSVTIDGCKEGYLAFLAKEISVFENINACDSDKRSILQADALKKIKLEKEIDFLDESTFKNSYHEVVFSLTKNLLSRKSKIKYFKLLSKKGVKSILYYSTDVVSDEKILSKSGFVHRYKIKKDDSGRGGVYLFCFTSELAPFLKIRVFFHLYLSGIKSQFYVLKKRARVMVKKFMNKG
jgi:hypothetical protein